MHRKTLLIRAAGAALLTLGAWTAYTQRAPTQPAEQSSMEIRNGLYAIRAEGRGNVGAYVTDGGVVLVDDEYSVDFDKLLAKVRSITNQPVKYVLNTHQHADHSDGNPKFLPLAEILIHKNARANMVAKNQPGQPRVTFADKAQLFPGGREVDIRHFGRGHTNGDSVIYFPAERTIHTGDLFVNGPYFIPAYADHGSLKEWPATIHQILATWDFDTVIPGHGPVTDRAGLEKFAGRLEQMWSRSKELSTQPDAKERISKMLRADFSEFGPTIAADAQVEGILAEIRAN